jgi:hypothetical protein
LPLSRLGQSFLAFGGELVPVLLQTPEDASPARFDILAEVQGIVMASLGRFLPAPLRFGDILSAGPGQFLFMLLETLDHTSPARLNILAKLGEVLCAGFTTLGAKVCSNPQGYAKDHRQHYNPIFSPSFHLPPPFFWIGVSLDARLGIILYILT